MITDSGDKASTRRQYTITQADLPLCCPMPTMRVWDAHPRVYLAIEKTGKATCPYCDADYTLQDFDKPHNQHPKNDD